MDKPGRLRIIRMGAGRLLSLPVFASHVVISHGRCIDTVIEEVISDSFLRRIRMTLASSKRTTDSGLVLRDLLLLLEEGSVGKRLSIRRNQSRGREEDSSSSYKGRIQELMDSLLFTFMSDLSDIFQVDIRDFEHLRSIYDEGMVLLHKLSVVGTGGTISLFPVGFVAALSCATKMVGRLRTIHNYDDEVDVIAHWVDSIIRVWLHSLGASTVKCQSDGTPIHGKGSVDDWVSYILAARNVFNGVKVYLRNPVYGLRDLDLGTLTFAEVEYRDIIAVHTVLCSMQRECEKMLKESLYVFLPETSFQHQQVRRLAMCLSSKVLRESAPGSMGEELERMRSVIESMTWLVRGCVQSHSSWIPLDFEGFSLSFRTDEFDKKEVYAMTVRSLLCVITALLLNTEYFSAAYEDYISGLVTTIFEKELGR